jgi:hypothetical protein
MKSRISNENPSPALKNAAVAHCCDAWERTFQTKRAEGQSGFDAGWEANNSYRKAMPPLSGYRSICDFIACVTYGILIEAIPTENSSKLLYAAQVALSSIRSQPKKEHARA